MRKRIELTKYDKYVQIAAHMVGLDYKKPYIRHGRRFYKPYRNYFYSALSGCDYEKLTEMAKQGYAEMGAPSDKGVYFWLTRKGLDWLGEKLGIQIHDEKR